MKGDRDEDIRCNQLLNAICAISRSMVQQREQLLKIFWKTPCEYREIIEAEYRDAVDWTRCRHKKRMFTPCSIEDCPLHEKEGS